MRRRRSPGDKTLGEALLTPTRIYVKPLLAGDPRDRRDQGAGPYHRRRLSRKFPRVLPKHLAAEIDLAAVQGPAGLLLAAQTGGVEPKEMLRTFNCGIGMIVVVAAGKADEVLEALQA